MVTKKAEKPVLNRVTIKIMGDEYNVVGAESAEYIDELVKQIEAKIDSIQKAHGDAKLSKTQLAILVALQLADEMVKLRIEHENLVRLIQEAK
ncbi:MAG: cell division protein ZapA [Firmicutes bacterium]|nr:cell division protein ZapA [Bacillota bacterium]